MKFTAYTFAAVDFLPVCLVCSLLLFGLFWLGLWATRLFDPCERDPEDDDTS